MNSICSVQLREMCIQFPFCNTVTYCNHMLHIYSRLRGSTAQASSFFMAAFQLLASAGQGPCMVLCLHPPWCGLGGQPAWTPQKLQKTFSQTTQEFTLRLTDNSRLRGSTAQASSFFMAAFQLLASAGQGPCMVLCLHPTTASQTTLAACPKSAIR